MKQKRRERTIKIGGKPVRQYEVQAHFRRFPGAAEPHWVCVRVINMQASFLIGNMVGPHPDARWVGDPAQAGVYLRRELTEWFGPDDARAANILLFRV